MVGKRQPLAGQVDFGKKVLPRIKPETMIRAAFGILGDLLDNSLAPFATRKDLLTTTQDLTRGINQATNGLKAYIHEGVETIMEGMEKLSAQLGGKRESG